MLLSWKFGKDQIVKKVVSVRRLTVELFAPPSSSVLAVFPSKEETEKVLWKPSPKALFGTTS